MYPGKSPEETAEADEAKAKEKSKVKIYDALMVRHWDEWDDGKRSHLFVAEVATGKARDLTPKFQANVPPAPFGGSSDYNFSPTGSELAFTAEPAKDLAWSTNTDIWIVSTSGNTPLNLTVDSPGADAQPSYSPDGDLLAFVSQARAGFEADRWALKVRDRSSGEVSDVTSQIDRPVQSYAWGSSRPVDPKLGAASRDLFLVLDDAGSVAIRRLSLLADGDGHVFVAERPGGLSGGVNHSVQVVPGGDGIVLVHGSSDRPNELFQAKADGSGLVPLTRHNATLVAGLDLAPAEGFTFPGADGDTVSGWLIKPPGFDPSRKYPVVFLIHGGPQGAWHDEWHNRWNYEMFAAPGYAVVAINPRGSTGYGQHVHRPDQQGLDGTGLRRPHEGARPCLEDVSLPRSDEDGGGGRVVWRVHGQLDRRPYGSVQGAGEPRGGLRPDEHVRHDRRTLVRRVGIRRRPVGGIENLPRSDAWRVRRQLQDADAGPPRLARLPGARGAGARDVHRPPAQRGPQPVRPVPRRGALDRQARQPDRLVARGPGVAGQVSEMKPIPGKPFRGKDAPDDAFRHLRKNHGIGPTIASHRLHKIKGNASLRPDDDVVIGRTGDVYNAKNGERIGSLTDPTLGTG